MTQEALVPSIAELRARIEQALAGEQPEQANALLSELWTQYRGAGVARYVVAQYERIAPLLRPAVFRLAIARSFTVEPLLPLLSAEAFTAGIHLEICLGDFNAYTQEILNPDSPLYAHQPDALLLAVQTRDLAPELWDRFPDLSAADVDASVERAVATLTNLVEVFRSRSSAYLLLHNFEAPVRPAGGILDAQRAGGQCAAVQRINLALQRLAERLPGVYIVDYDGLVARHGRLAWHDERKWLSARLPIAAANLIHLAGEWVRYIHPLAGRQCKALVVDLDNTLWGGVVGEDSLEGLQLGETAPGAFHLALQRAILDLYRRGIIIAVASKNNHADAMEVLEQHPNMLLRPQHLAALRINWNDKATSIREIAAELNIGLDAVAFLDDNPFERQLVRTQLPMVTVINLSPDPAGYVAALRGVPAFERLTLSEEDQARGEFYARDRLRTEHQTSMASLEDFYRSLAMRVVVEEASPATFARVAQLTQKTNQFNLTTRRYSEQQIVVMASDAAWKALTVRVSDTFGDNGLVGVVLVSLDGRTAAIDTFLLSCRVMGRTVETAVLAALAAILRDAGVERLTGSYIPTKKNAAVSGVYEAHGFACVARREYGSADWLLDLREQRLDAPEWIDLHVPVRSPAP